LLKPVFAGHRSCVWNAFKGQSTAAVAAAQAALGNLHGLERRYDVGRTCHESLSTTGTGQCNNAAQRGSGRQKVATVEENPCHFVFLSFPHAH